MRSQCSSSKHVLEGRLLGILGPALRSHLWSVGQPILVMYPPTRTDYTASAIHRVSESAVPIRLSGPFAMHSPTAAQVA